MAASEIVTFFLIQRRSGRSRTEGKTSEEHRRFTIAWSPWRATDPQFAHLYGQPRSSTLLAITIL